MGSVRRAQCARLIELHKFTRKVPTLASLRLTERPASLKRVEDQHALSARERQVRLVRGFEGVQRGRVGHMRSEHPRLLCQHGVQVF